MFEPGQRVGNYEIVRELGRGGMGTVFLAREVEYDREFALKIASPEAPPYVHQRFLQEVKVTRRLQDLHLVAAHEADVHRENGLAVPYLVMEYLAGETLADVLDALTERGAAMEISDVIAIARQSAAGLARAHAKAIIHRDIKPSNIFICRSEAASVVKVIDFGLALIQRETMVDAGTPMLSPPYAAPEQWENWAGVDTAADVYALGCTMFEMLSGSPPFGVGGELRAAHTTQPPPDVSTARRNRIPSSAGVPRKLVELVDVMLAKNPVHRPDLGEVRRVLDGMTSTSRIRGGSWSRILPWVLMCIGGGGLLALAVAVALAYWHGSPPAIDAGLPKDPSAIDAGLPKDAHLIPPSVPDAPMPGVPGAVRVEGAGRDAPLLGITESDIPSDDAFRASAGVRAPAESYWISEHPVTWAELEPVASKLPELAPARGVDPDDFPARGLSWWTAREFCRLRGGDLPTEEQWEWAARGGRGGKPTRAHIEYQRVRSKADGDHWRRVSPEGIHAVGTQPDDVAQTPHGRIYDLLTEVEEWTRDTWRDPRTGQKEGFDGFFVTRGFPPLTDVQFEASAVFAHRFRLLDKPPTRQVRRENIGFRCVWPAP